MIISKGFGASSIYRLVYQSHVPQNLISLELPIIKNIDSKYQELDPTRVLNPKTPWHLTHYKYDRIILMSIHIHRCPATIENSQIWHMEVFPQTGVPQIIHFFMGFSTINHPFWVTPHGNPRFFQRHPSEGWRSLSPGPPGRPGPSRHAQRTEAYGGFLK